MTYDLSRMTLSDRRAVARSRPKTAEQLHYWIASVLGLDIPRVPRCVEHGHVAPFDYVRDAFFESFADACVWANRGGGKTMLGAVVSLLDAVHKPGVAIRILGGSLEQSQKMYRYLVRLAHRPGVLELLGQGDGGGAAVPGCQATAARPARRAAVTARTLRFANGSEVEILAQSERSVRGNRVQKMRCDEVELFDTDVWTSCQLVVESRDDAGGAVEAFSTYHRVGGLMQRIIEQAERRRSPVYRWCVLDVLARCPAADCRGCPLEPDCRGRARDGDGFYRIADALAAKNRVDNETWQAEMLCLRPSRRDAVFAAFSRARHVAATQYDSRLPTYRAMDFGYTNPFVCLWIQVSGNGDVFVIGEYLRSRATLSVNIEAVRKLDPGPIAASYCDPAGGQASQMTGTTVRAELKAAGMATIARPAAIVDGLELIRRALDGQIGSSRPGLRIDPSCDRLILAMEAYRYAEPSGDRPASETPLKDGVHDHPIDALRYFFVNNVRPRYRVSEAMY